jgi:hypothetical protein
MASRVRLPVVSGVFRPTTALRPAVTACPVLTEARRLEREADRLVPRSIMHFYLHAHNTPFTGPWLPPPPPQIEHYDVHLRQTSAITRVSVSLSYRMLRSFNRSECPEPVLNCDKTRGKAAAHIITTPVSYCNRMPVRNGIIFGLPTQLTSSQQRLSITAVSSSSDPSAKL